MANHAAMADWIYTGKPLAPLKGYPGVMWERPRKGKRDYGAAARTSDGVAP